MKTFKNICFSDADSLEFISTDWRRTKLRIHLSEVGGCGIGCGTVLHSRVYTATPFFINFTADRKLMWALAFLWYFEGLLKAFQGLSSVLKAFWILFEGFSKHFLTELGVCGTFFRRPHFLKNSTADHKSQVPSTTVPHTAQSFRQYYSTTMLVTKKANKHSINLAIDKKPFIYPAVD